METLNLTPSELELIKLNREKEELEKKQKEIERKAQRERDIQSELKYIEEAKQKSIKQVNATKAFHKNLPDWKLVITTKTNTRTLTEYTNLVEPKSNNWETKVVWEQPYELYEAHLELNEQYKIEVKEHITYGKWDYRGTNKGFRMFLRGPGIPWNKENYAYKNANTITKRINEIKGKTLSKQKEENKKKTALQNVVDKLQTLYPDATITTEAGYRHHNNYGYYRRQNNDVEIQNIVTVIFKNGIKISYVVYSDESLSRKELYFNVKDSWQLMEILNGVNIPKQEE